MSRKMIQEGNKKTNTLMFDYMFSDQRLVPSMRKNSI